MERYPVVMKIEVRGEPSAPVIEGYAAVFNSLSEDLGGFKEQIAPGAFKSSLSGDVRALYNHDTGQVLGRTKAGTLQIAEDGTGLSVRIMPPTSAAGLVESMRRGDVDQMSFGFTVNKDAWAKTPSGPVRTLLDVSLREVSVVPFPAYQGTSASVRGLWGDLPEIPELYRRAPVEIQQQAARRAPSAQGSKYATKGASTMATMDKLAPVDMRRKADNYLQRVEQLDEIVNAEKRQMSEEERGEYDNAVAEHKRLSEAATRAEQIQQLTGEADDDGDGALAAAKDYAGRNLNLRRDPRFIEERAMGTYIRTGDASPLLQYRASNPVDMKLSTLASAGYAVPVGHFNRIVEKRDEQNIADKLGVRTIPGKGTTVNVIVEAGDVEPFKLTAELGPKDKDAPIIGLVPVTLKTYSKYIDITEELLADEDSNLMAWIEGWIGRGMAKTHNQLLIAAAELGGTNVPLAAGAITAADVQAMWSALPDEYGDNAKWLMRRATLNTIQTIQGSPFVYLESPQGTRNSLMGAPVVTTGAADIVGTTNNPIFLGDWYFMGKRENPAFNFLRNPYIRDVEDVVRLRYFFRVAYVVLQAEAILKGTKA